MAIMWDLRLGRKKEENNQPDKNHIGEKRSHKRAVQESREKMFVSSVVSQQSVILWDL